MEIKDFNELNVLHKLLMTIKTSDNLMSLEIDLFAGSPFINDILKRIRQDYIMAVRQKFGDKHIEEWLNETRFRVDSEMGKAIQRRIQNWDTSIIKGLKDRTKTDFIEIAKSYIEPIDYEPKELEKLVSFIENRLNASL